MCSLVRRMCISPTCARVLEGVHMRKSLVPDQSRSRRTIVLLHNIGVFCDDCCFSCGCKKVVGHRALEPYVCLRGTLYPPSLPSKFPCSCTCPGGATGHKARAPCTLRLFSRVPTQPSVCAKNIQRPCPTAGPSRSTYLRLGGASCTLICLCHMLQLWLP